MYDAGREMDHGSEGVIGFVASGGDPFEFLEFAEEVLDQMTPAVKIRVQRERLKTLRALGDHDAGAAIVQLLDDPVRVECRVGDKPVEIDSLDQRGDADGVVTVGRQKFETNKVAERVGERDDFRRPAALRLAYGLAASPPFAPCPWRWTGTIVASTMANSMSGSSDTASKIRLKTSALTQSRKRLKAVFHLPKAGGRSRHGLPVRAIQSTASTNRRLSVPDRPGSADFPKQCGSILAHWASVRQKRTIHPLPFGSMKLPRPQQTVSFLNRP